MKEQKYVTLGTSEISKDLFQNIFRPLDNTSLKPIGGLWATNFINEKYCICEWLDYILYENNELAYYKNITNGCVFTLKENSNILVIDSKTKIKELAKKYPSYHYLLNNTNNDYINTIDFEKLSREYDGVYVIFDLFGYDKEAIAFRNWCVNTLLLFNLDCIKEYQTIKISVNPEDLDYVPYISNISETKQVIEHSDHYYELYNYIETKLLEIINTCDNYNIYDEYFEALINCANICIKDAIDNKKETLEKLNKSLDNTNVKRNHNEIVTNIAINILFNYLSKKDDKIKSLKKSQFDKKKYYKIL